MPHRIWTPAEVLRLRSTATHAKLAKELGRTKQAVFRKRQQLRTKESSEVAQLRARIAELEAGAPPADYALPSAQAPAFGRYISAAFERGKWRQIGLVGDTHLGCREERLAELHATYDIFAREGITEVYHAGNIVDGYIPKINGASAIITTPDAQAAYVAANYPQRTGITTFFITGDDHEGWWIKEGWNWGAYCEFVCRSKGREDLRYVGHVEADIEFAGPAGCAPTVMKVQHPGGGSAYARSYTGQKQVEAFEGGEKPNILVQGHYHVSNYMHDRNVHVISLPGFQDQTIFARKKRLRMEVGAAIIRFLQDETTGAISRFQIEWIRYFNRGFYKAYIPSDEYLRPAKLTRA